MAGCRQCRSAQRFPQCRRCAGVVLPVVLSFALPLCLEGWMTTTPPSRGAQNRGIVLRGELGPAPNMQTGKVCQSHLRFKTLKEVMWHFECIAGKRCIRRQRTRLHTSCQQVEPGSLLTCRYRGHNDSDSIWGSWDVVPCSLYVGCPRLWQTAEIQLHSVCSEGKYSESHCSALLIVKPISVSVERDDSAIVSSSLTLTLSSLKERFNHSFPFNSYFYNVMFSSI